MYCTWSQLLRQILNYMKDSHNKLTDCLERAVTRIHLNLTCTNVKMKFDWKVCIYLLLLPALFIFVHVENISGTCLCPIIFVLQYHCYCHGYLKKVNQSHIWKEQQIQLNSMVQINCYNQSRKRWQIIETGLMACSSHSVCSFELKQLP